MRIGWQLGGGQTATRRFCAAKDDIPGYTSTPELALTLVCRRSCRVRRRRSSSAAWVCLVRSSRRSRMVAARLCSSPRRQGPRRPINRQKATVGPPGRLGRRPLLAGRRLTTERILHERRGGRERDSSGPSNSPSRPGKHHYIPLPGGRAAASRAGCTRRGRGGRHSRRQPRDGTRMGEQGH